MFCELVLSVSESLVFPLPLQRSAFGNIVSFYKTERSGRAKQNAQTGARSESGSTAPTSQQALTRRISRRGGCRTTLMAQRPPQRARRECWRGTRGHKESAARTKRVEGTQPIHRTWPQLRHHVLLQPRSPTRPLACASITG